MVTMMSFTTFTLVISVITLLLSLIFFCVEAFLFHWANWDSWLVEQSLMRCLEAAYSIGTLYFLRKVPPHEVMPERRSLLSPEKQYASSPYAYVHHTDESSGSREDDFSVKRKLSASLDRSNIMEI
jgi:hypothetical protein